MRYLFFDPPYSFFFNDIALKLQLNGHECFYWGYNICNFIYYPDIKKMKRCELNSPLIRDVSDSLLERAVCEQSVGNLSPNPLDECSRKKLKILIKKILSYTQKEDIFIFYNDLRWLHAPLIHILKTLGMRYFVFELGPIRDATCTVSTTGINSRAQIATGSIIAKDCLNFAYEKRPLRMKNKNLFFIVFILLRQISKICFFEPKNILGRKSFIDYVKILLRSKIAERPLSKKFDFFVALQLESDTQRVFSDFKMSNQELINMIFELATNLELSHDRFVFKQHPLDVNNYDFHGFPVSNASSHNLIQRTKAILTVNSTVGFEGILAEKPVFCFGESFYTLDEWVYKHDVVDFLRKNPASKGKKEKIINTLSNGYMMHGDIFNYTDDDVTQLANKLAEI